MSDELSVPTPQIVSDYLTTNNFLKKRDGPVIFTLGRVLKSDGSKLLISEVDKAGYYIYQKNPAGVIKIWNKKEKKWALSSNVSKDDRELSLLEYVKEDPVNPWKGTLLFMGAEGKFLKTENTGYPQYFIRCYFEHKLSEGAVQTGEGDKSIGVKLPVLGGDIKAGLNVGDIKSPNWVNYYIKDNSGETAYVKLEKDGKVTIVNNSGNAKITIHSNGDIEITPNAAGKLVLRGNVEIIGTLRVGSNVWTS